MYEIYKRVNGIHGKKFLYITVAYLHFESRITYFCPHYVTQNLTYVIWYIIIAAGDLIFLGMQDFDFAKI